jgi:hypothetical protein
MNRDDIIRMAREAGIRAEPGNSFADDMYFAVLYRFAALIEQHLSFDSIHTCHAECQRPACVAVREAVKAEREACAAICDRFQARDVGMQPAECAAAIRYRGEK